MMSTNSVGVALAEVGSFFAGGTLVTLSGQARQQVQVARNAPARPVDLNGDYITGQCYVQFMRLAKPAFDAPVMFWHGGAMTGATWETTPDGRPGWQQYFLQHGFDVYNCDAVERGRAGWSAYPQIYDSAPIFRTMNDAWTLFRFGKTEDYATSAERRVPFAGLRFPVEAFDRLAAQFVPRWTDHAQMSIEAYCAALQRTGPVWLIAHSQGGNLALEVANRFPQLIRGLVVIEPASAPVDVEKAVDVPHLFVWADNISQSTIWQSYRQAADDYANRLIAAGGVVDITDLPSEGIHGNSHLPMMDDNSDLIAGRIVQWISRFT